VAWDGAQIGRTDVELFDDLLRSVQHVGFVAVGTWAVLRWSRRRDDQSRWLAATFGAIGLTVAISALGRVLAVDGVAPWLSRLSIAVLVLFPYLLLRFLDTFEPVGTRWRRGVGAAVAAQVLAALVVPFPDAVTGASGTAFGVFTAAIVLTWVSVLPLVGARFWRAGRGRPTLARRRLRLLGVALVTLAATLLLAAAAEEQVLLSVVTQLGAVLSVTLFVLAFLTPPVLRRWWRQPEEQALHEAAVGLLAATTPDEVAATVVPGLRRLVSARGMALVSRGQLLASEGLDADELRRTTEIGGIPGGASGHRRVTLQDGALHVWVDRFAPFFGAEEQEQLDRFGLLTDLALHRARLLASEREARDALQETNAELESFVYSASHDLKSPLIAMLSYIDLLRNDHREALGEEGAWYVDRMAANGAYMEALIRDLLELSRVGRLQTEAEDVALGPLVEGLAAELTEHRDALAVEVGELPVLRINPLRARQLFANLLENAAKHGGDDVRVTVRAHPARGGDVEISVADDGPGVPEDYRERVFGVFERLQVDDETGTGIGLAICRKIVESVGGRIWLADREDGAEFRLRFPAEVVTGPQSTREEVPA
jgi:signal transduction histidine kinase